MKKLIKKCIILMLASWFAFIACFTVSVLNAVAIVIDKRFYFLVSTSMHIEASTHWVAWNGGAGYLLKRNNQEYVVYAVYLSEDEGQIAQTTELNDEINLISVSVEKLYFNTLQEKRNAQKIKGAFQSLYGCLLILEEGINNLAHSGTQEDIKRILGILELQLDFLSIEYKNIFPKFADSCKNGKNKIEKLLDGNIFLGDLRYLLCELSVNYINFSHVFAI